MNSTSSSRSSASPENSGRRQTNADDPSSNEPTGHEPKQRQHERAEPEKREPKKRTRKSRVSPNLHPAGTPRIRYRIRFAKTDLLRWISHRDLASLWERIGRRAGLPFSMTEGFHPKPRLMFPSALPLGVESLDEVVDLELNEEWDEEQLLAALREDQQPGLTIHQATRVDLSDGKARLAGRQYHVTLPDDFCEPEGRAVDQQIKQLKQNQTITTDRSGKEIVTHVPTQIPILELEPEQLPERLVVRLINSEAASLKIHDVLELLDIGDWPQRGATLIRTRTFLQGELEHL